MSELTALNRTHVLLAGIEAHVCVLQTALDLLSAGFRVYAASDAIGARHAIDHDTALRRIETCGGTLVTTEMALFEWCRAAGSAEFKAVSQLVKDPPPA
jgi:nicotinamidase-related amidase